MAKATDAEVDHRISDVKSLILTGDTYSDIVRYCARKWGISPRQTDNYMKRAKEELKESNQATFQENLSVITNQLWAVYKRAVASENVSEQRNCLMSLAKLRGLDQQTINHVIEDKRELEGSDVEALEAVLLEGESGDH